MIIPDEQPINEAYDKVSTNPEFTNKLFDIVGKYAIEKSASNTFDMNFIKPLLFSLKI